MSNKVHKYDRIFEEVPSLHTSVTCLTNSVKSEGKRHRNLRWSFKTVLLITKNAVVDGSSILCIRRLFARQIFHYL